MKGPTISEPTPFSLYIPMTKDELKMASDFLEAAAENCEDSFMWPTHWSEERRRVFRDNVCGYFGWNPNDYGLLGDMPGFSDANVHNFLSWKLFNLAPEGPPPDEVMSEEDSKTLLHLAKQMAGYQHVLGGHGGHFDECNKGSCKFIHGLLPLEVKGGVA